jgi:type I restriction enzyme S subunit
MEEVVVDLKALQRLGGFASPELRSLSFKPEFARIVHQFERLRAQQREAQRQAEHLFQTLLHRAFRGSWSHHHEHTALA